MKGQKFSQDKLPIGTMILTQFPNALLEVARSSRAGNLKYRDSDLDWLNFSRVEDAKFQYTNAAIRHLIEAETHTFNEDMKEYDPKVRHLAQSAWNLLALLETELRKEKTVKYTGEPLKVIEDKPKSFQETLDLISKYFKEDWQKQLEQHTVNTPMSEEDKKIMEELRVPSFKDTAVLIEKGNEKILAQRSNPLETVIEFPMGCSQYYKISYKGQNLEIPKNKYRLTINELLEYNNTDENYYPDREG